VILWIIYGLASAATHQGFYLPPTIDKGNQRNDLQRTRQLQLQKTFVSYTF
jgi:hypothetical protein